MKENMLKVNDDDTEFLVIRVKHACKKVPTVTSLHIGDADVEAVALARYIGLILDDKLSMVEHAKTVNVTKSSYMHLRNIAMV